MKQVLCSGRKYIRPNCKKVLFWRLGSGNLCTPDVNYYEITETENSAFAVGEHIQLIKSACHPSSLVAAQYPNLLCTPTPPPPPIHRVPNERFPTDLTKKVYVAYVHYCLFIFLSLVNE